MVDDALGHRGEGRAGGRDGARGRRASPPRTGAAAELIWVGEDGRLRLLAKRRFTSLGKLLDEILKSRVERIGVSKEVARALKKNGRVLQGERLQEGGGKEGWLKEGLAKTLSDSVGV